MQQKATSNINNPTDSRAEFPSPGKIQDTVRALANLELGKHLKDTLLKRHNLKEEDYAEWEHDYKRWLALNKLFPEEELAPTLPIDEVWHLHILDTEKYFADCHAFLGRYLHHRPESSSVSGQLDETYESTRRIWKQCFGAELSGTKCGCSTRP